MVEKIRFLSKSPREIDAGMAGLEQALLAVVGRVATWVAPLPSAVLVGQAVGEIFDLGEWLPWVMAFVVEFVGLSLAGWWTTAREWNVTRTRKTDPRANERLAVGLLGGYFVTVVGLLLALELSLVLEGGELRRLTSLFFPGLSLVSLIALNERIAHYKRVREVELGGGGRNGRRTARRTAGRTAGQPVGSGLHGEGARVGIGGSAVGGQLGGEEGAQYAEEGGLGAANRTREERRVALLEALVDVYQGDPQIGPTAAAKAIGVTRNTIYEYQKSLVTAGRVRLVRNGDKRIQRVEVL